MSARVACLLVVAACGGSGHSAETVPATTLSRRAPTIGDELMAHAPAGATAILELDFTRLRTNETVGPVWRAFTRDGGRDDQFDLIADADALVVCSYGVGTDDAAHLVLVRLSAPRSLAGVFVIDDRTIAIAPPDVIARVGAVRSGQVDNAADDRSLLDLRELAMPDGAEGATFRLSARLDAAARVKLAADLDLDHVPVSISAWGDVADDLAVVALLGGDDRAGAGRLAKSLERVRARLAHHLPSQLALLAPALNTIRIESQGNSVRTVLVIGPKRLAALSQQLLDSAPAAAEGEVGS